MAGPTIAKGGGWNRFSNISENNHVCSRYPRIKKLIRTVIYWWRSKGTIHGLGFKMSRRIKHQSKRLKHQIDTCTQGTRTNCNGAKSKVMGKKAEAAVYRKYIKMKKITKINELQTTTTKVQAGYGQSLEEAVWFLWTRRINEEQLNEFVVYH